jgi:hypothetical protein
VYDLARARPSDPITRPESREITELRAVKTRHPELAGAVDMHIELLEMQRRVQGRVPLPPLEFDANTFQRHQLEGRPLLQFEQIPLDLTDLRLLVRQTADVLHRFDALDAAEFQQVHTLGRGTSCWWRDAARRAGERVALRRRHHAWPSGARPDARSSSTCSPWRCARFFTLRRSDAAAVELAT